MKVYLMRHGETHYNKKGLIQGSTDIELTDLGVELAEKSAEGFLKDGIRFQRIYTSPLVRARKTAECVNALQQTELVTDDRLKEMHFGLYEGKALKTIKEIDENVVYCFSRPSKYVADGSGENFSDVYARVIDFMEHEIRPLEKDPSMKQVLVVCHGAVIRAILTWIRHMDLDEFWTIHQPNCSINRIDLTDGVFTSEQENIFYYEAEELMHRGIL